MAFPGIERVQARVELPVIVCLTLAAVLKRPELRVDPVAMWAPAGYWPIPKLKAEALSPVPADSEARSLSLRSYLKGVENSDPLA